ncbi:MAG: hypothetical protein MZW92_04745 [Comamonadaceae bacterium]|nr:hypothetical protein [Comamonadaceae bacterium]
MRGVDEGKAQIGFGNSSTTVDGAGRQRALSEEGDQGLPARQPVPAVLPGRRHRRRQRQLASPTSRASRWSTQPKGNTAELLTAAGAEDQRPELPVAVEGQLPAPTPTPCR